MLERCEGITVCELRSRSLQEVSLADCKQLRTLKLPCPALRSINLEECKHLKQVWSPSVRLQQLYLACRLSSCPALPCPALPCPALPCPALMIVAQWQVPQTGLVNTLSVAMQSLPIATVAEDAPSQTRPPQLPYCWCVEAPDRPCCCLVANTKLSSAAARPELAMRNRRVCGSAIFAIVLIALGCKSPWRLDPCIN